MKRNKIIAVDEAVRVILNNDTVAISGFGGTGVPEELAMAIETRFLTTGVPRDLTLIYAAGIGDGKTGGSKHFAHDCMVKPVMCGDCRPPPHLLPLPLQHSHYTPCLPQP